MNKRRNRDHRVKLAKHLHVYRNDARGKWAVIYRPPGEKSATLYYDDKHPSADLIRDLYVAHIRNGEPVPARVREVASADGTWNAALDFYEKAGGDVGMADLARPGAVKAAVKFLREMVGDQLMRKTKAGDVWELWQARHDEKGYGAANDLRTVLSKVTRIAHRKEWITVNLMGDIKKITKDNHKRMWHVAEVEQWRAFYPDHRSIERRSLEVIYEFGARGPSDCTRLSWAMTRLDPEASARVGLPADTLWIRFEQKKVKGKSTAWVDRPVLGRDLLECLKHCPKDGGVVGVNGLSSTPWLVNPETGEGFKPDTFSQNWRRWRRAAGMAEDFNPHGARHAQGGDSAEFGIAPGQGRKLTGHTLGVFAIYTEQAEAKYLAGMAAVQMRDGREKRMRRTAA